jgi:general stress protein 26
MPPSNHDEPTSSPQSVAHVWEMMEKIGFCMFSSLDRSNGGEEIRSRPMAAYVEREEGRVCFLTDADSYKDEEVAANPNVNLAFADAGSHSYVSVTGRAAVSNDRDKIRELFNVPAKAWWDSPDDPSIRLITVTPRDAQYWDSPGTVRAYIKMAAAAVSSSRPEMGENEKVDMTGG